MSPYFVQAATEHARDALRRLQDMKTAVTSVTSAVEKIEENCTNRGKRGNGEGYCRIWTSLRTITYILMKFANVSIYRYICTIACCELLFLCISYCTSTSKSKCMNLHHQNCWCQHLLTSTIVYLYTEVMCKQHLNVSRVSIVCSKVVRNSSLAGKYVVLYWSYTSLAMHCLPIYYIIYIYYTITYTYYIYNYIYNYIYILQYIIYTRVTGALWLHICLISFMVTLFDITSVGRLMKYPSLVVSQSRSITCSFLLHMYYKTWWAGWLNHVVHPQKEPGVCWVYNFLFVLLRTNLIIWDWILNDVTYVAHRLVIFWERDSYLLLLLLLL